MHIRRAGTKSHGNRLKTKTLLLDWMEVFNQFFKYYNEKKNEDWKALQKRRHTWLVRVLTDWLTNKVFVKSKEYNLWNHSSHVRYVEISFYGLITGLKLLINNEKVSSWALFKVTGDITFTSIIEGIASRILGIYLQYFQLCHTQYLWCWLYYRILGSYFNSRSSRSKIEACILQKTD